MKSAFEDFFPLAPMPRAVTEKPKYFFQDLEDESSLAEELHRAPYEETCELLGSPAHDECFA